VNLSLFHTLRPLRHVLVGLLALAATLPALALKEIAIRESDTVVVPVSLRDQTRIKVKHGRISDVLGDVYDAQRNPTGRVAVIQDDDGEAYVKPVIQVAGALPGSGLPYSPSTSANAPIKLDFKSSQGSFALLLQPMDTPGQTLEVRVVGAPAPAAAVGARSRSMNHVRAIKALTLAMANPAAAEAAGANSGTVRELNQEVQLWREARFVLRTAHFSGALVGEAYELTNVSAAQMVIDERELYTQGVLAVSAKRLILEPGESTPVWIVRASAMRE
jgi:conjugal transfer pilus assembly protein TraK